MQGASADRLFSYNITRYINPYLKSLVELVRRSHPHMLKMCEILQPAAESLVHHHRLRDDADFNAIAEDLKQYM